MSPGGDGEHWRRGSSVSLGGAVSPITGTAQFPDGVIVVLVTVTVAPESGPPQTLTSGPFTLPIAQ